VTGGNGRLARSLAAKGTGLVQTMSRSELDVTDSDAIRRALDRLRPAAVINAAVCGVADAELRPDWARAVNATAPGHIARACADRGIPMIHVSTDYVFGAPTHKAWCEDDPVSPVNVYGRTKAEGERAVLESAAIACVARVAWLFGDGLDFIARLLRGGDTTVAVNDQVGSPTPIYPLAGRLLNLVERVVAADDGVPITLHLAGSPPVSRADWVATTFAALERNGRQVPRLERVPLESMNTPSARPTFSALDCRRAALLFGGELDWRGAAQLPETFPLQPN
jgi:dTDP-4-dehydrorhamnose reductase